MDYSLGSSCSLQQPPFRASQTTRGEAMVCCSAEVWADRWSVMEGLNMIATSRDESLKLLHLRMNCLRNFHSNRSLQTDIAHTTKTTAADFDYYYFQRNHRYCSVLESMLKKMREKSIRKHWTTLPLLSFHCLHRCHTYNLMTAMSIASCHNSRLSVMEMSDLTVVAADEALVGAEVAVLSSSSASLVTFEPRSR